MDNRPKYRVKPRTQRNFEDAEITFTHSEKEGMRETAVSKLTPIYAVLFILIFSTCVCNYIFSDYSPVYQPDVFDFFKWIILRLLLVFIVWVISMFLVEILVGKVILYSKYKNELRKEKREARRESYEIALHNAKMEAEKISNELNGILDALPNRVTDLGMALQYANEWLQQARFEYREKAYGPFWDTIEKAVLQLADYYENLQNLQQTVYFYSSSLVGKEHNFPESPLQNIIIPNPESIINELHTVVRMGQTNFQFANIWEHRRTQKILITGFSTLGDAITNLSDSITTLVRKISKPNSMIGQENPNIRWDENEWGEIDYDEDEDEDEIE